MEELYVVEFFGVMILEFVVFIFWDCVFGVYVIDVDGNEFIDLIVVFGVVLVGYVNKCVVVVFFE